MDPDRLLVLDVGNSNVVIGLWEGETLVSSWRLSTIRERSSDEYGIMMRQMVDSAGGGARSAIVASVVPPLNTTIGTMIESYFGIRPLFVEPGVRTGLSIQTEHPLEVGADRIVNAVAAHHEYGGPTIIVDFGTATTFDLVTAQGEYRGGIIAPGLTISSEALFARAARLPRVEIRKPAQLIGANTVASLQSGIYYGYIGLVDGILGRMKREIPALRTIVATGGTPIPLEESEHIERYDPHLTLKGLRLVHEKNRAGRKTSDR